MALFIPNSIENDTPADAAELQENYATIQTYTNSSLIHRDGSVAMTSPLTLVGDPTQNNHAANKQYVDAVVAVVDSAGRGIVAYAETTSNYGPTTGDAIPGCSVTFTATLGRRYKVTGHAIVSSSVALDNAWLGLYDGSGYLQIAAIQVAGANIGESMDLFWVSSATFAGSKTLTLHINLVNGTGVLSGGAGPTLPTFILVEDIGVL